MLRKLFLVDGLAGAGKSDLIEFVDTSHRRSAAVVSKYTTRSPRQPEEAPRSDLKFVSEKKFADLHSDEFYAYPYAGKSYGFYRSDVLKALESYENVFIIIRNRGLIEKLRKDFSEIAVVIPIFVYADRNLIVKRLTDDGFDEPQIDFRLQRSEHSWTDYLEYPDSALRVVINNSEKTDFHRKINALLDEFASDKIDSADYLYINPSLRFRIIKSLKGFKGDIARHLRDNPYEKNVFVMMKFRPENEAFYEYIKTEVEAQGFVCVRADADEWNITNNVYNPLAVLYCCKYGIALFDKVENPDDRQDYSANVAYELGIMQYQDKQTLILKHNSLPDVPFDLVKDLRKPYSKEIDFKRLFSQWLVEVRRG